MEHTTTTKLRARTHRGTAETLTPMTARGRTRAHPKPPTSRLAEVRARREKYSEATRFFTLNGTQMRFCPELAGEVGFLESLILLQYEFWAATEGIPVGNHIAIHDSVRTLRAAFKIGQGKSNKFCGGTTVDAAFNSLVEQGLLRWETAPGGRNDGRYVFICFEKARTLRSIAIKNCTLQYEPEESEDEVSDSWTPVHDEETPSQEVSKTQTPPQVSTTWTPESRGWTPPSKSWTPPSSSGTPAAAPYKERVRAEENKENRERGGETRAPGFEAIQGEGAPTHTTQLENSSLSPDDLTALFYEPDVQVLLAVFGFNPTRPDTLREKDWESLTGAVDFMRREKLEGGDLRAFSQIANLRWSEPPYLSQLETHFYRLLPGRARAKSRQIEAAHANPDGTPAPDVKGTPVFPTPPADELLDTKQEKRRRIIKACATVFSNLPETEQTLRREAAVRALNSLEKDRYLRDLGFGRPQSFGIAQSWRENLLKSVWLDHRRTCDAQLARMEEHQNTDIGADELGEIPALASFLEPPAPTREQLAPPTPPSLPEDAEAPASWNTGERMTGVGDVLGGLMKQLRPPEEKQA